MPMCMFRLVRATSMPPDSESQLSSRSDGDQTDNRMEHSDEDIADKVPKRTASMRAAKKPTTAKTEVPVNERTRTKTDRHTRGDKPSRTNTMVENYGQFLAIFVVVKLWSHCCMEVCRAPLCS